MRYHPYTPRPGKKKRVAIRKKKADFIKGLIFDAVRYGFIVLLCLVMALIFQENWLDQRDYITMERARLLMESITPTPQPPATPTPKPTPTPTEGPTPSPTPVPTPTPRLYVVNSKFTDFIAQNPDTVGWITIADTPIDYPVVQTDNNDYYLEYNFNGEKSTAGAIFLDYRCSITSEFPPHYILYGHRMKNGTMFKGLIRFMDEKFFEAHRTFEFDTLYEDMEWEIFSAYITDTSDPYIQTSFSSAEEWLEFIEYRHNKSMHATPEIELSADDIVLTLSTCTYEVNNGRFVVHARLIRDEAEETTGD